MGGGIAYNDACPVEMHPTRRSTPLARLAYPHRWVKRESGKSLKANLPKREPPEVRFCVGCQKDNQKQKSRKVKVEGSQKGNYRVLSIPGFVFENVHSREVQMMRFIIVEFVMTTVSSPVSSPVTLSDGELNERISGLRKAKADKTITPEQESELRDLLAVANNRLQIIRRNKARESLRTFRKLRNHKAARRLISVHTKEMISAITKNDPDIKGKGTVEQTKAYMDSLASENGMKELEKIFDLVRDCVKAAPDLANRETVFEGNIPACDILFSTFGFKTSSKAVDIDVDSTIAKELIGDATPQE